MKDEIKEILDFIKEQIEKETLSYEPDIELSKEEAKLLLNYITNLQKEKKIPEKINLKLNDWTTPTQCDIELSKKIDEIIDYLQYLKSKGE